MENESRKRSRPSSPTKSNDNNDDQSPCKKPRIEDKGLLAEIHDLVRSDWLHSPCKAATVRIESLHMTVRISNPNHGDTVYLYHVEVDTEHRRKGHFSRLLTALERLWHNVNVRILGVTDESTLRYLVEERRYEKLDEHAPHGLLYNSFRQQRTSPPYVPFVPASEQEATIARVDSIPVDAKKTIRKVSTDSDQEASLHVALRELAKKMDEDVEVRAEFHNWNKELLCSEVFRDRYCLEAGEWMGLLPLGYTSCSWDRHGKEVFLPHEVGAPFAFVVEWIIGNRVMYGWGKHTIWYTMLWHAVGYPHLVRMFQGLLEIRISKDHLVPIDKDGDDPFLAYCLHGLRLFQTNGDTSLRDRLWCSPRRFWERVGDNAWSSASS